MIKKEQFQLQINRLIDTFGERAFSEQREYMMWERAQKYSYDDVINVVDDFISKSKTAPLPHDFGEMLAKEGRRNGLRVYALGELQPKEIAKCFDCADSGFIRLERTSDPDPWAKWGSGAAPCHCERGKLVSQNKKFNLGPQYADFWSKSYSKCPEYPDGDNAA